MRILQCKDSVFFYNTCNKTKKKIKQIQKSTSGTITGPCHLHHDFQFLQLTVLQFSRRKNGVRELDVVTSEVLRWSVMTESGVNQKELS